MGDGTRENPYTREDVLNKIKENGGITEGLDLSGKVFEIGIDLSNLNMNGIYLYNSSLESANFNEANLEGAYLYESNLERAGLSKAHVEGALLISSNLKGAYLFDTKLQGADLSNAHMEDAILNGASLEGAGLMGTHLEKASLYHANIDKANFIGAHLSEARLRNVVFTYETKFDLVDWGDYIFKEEREGQFADAIGTYRQLKIWYSQHGMYDVAGKFFFREMTVKRKAQNWWPNPINRAFLKLLSLLCGYGEKPERVVLSAAGVVFALAISYYTCGNFTPNTFLNSLYYSAVSFVALGYGSWVLEPIGWSKYMGVVEAFLGVFMMALFLVTFTRKMTR